MTSVLLLSVLLVLLCGISDRIIGSGKFGRTKPVLTAAILLGGIAFLVHLPILAVATFPIAFLVWRTPAWGVTGGSINPEPKKALGTFLRHLFALSFLVPGYFAAVPMIPLAIGLVIFAAIATGLAVLNYNWFKKGIDRNGLIEKVRGCALGAVLAITFIL